MVKAISLWQPWATIWLLSDPDEKLFETRHWYTRHRGRLLIHAAKKQDGEVRECLGEDVTRAVLGRHGLMVEGLGYGAIIGEIDLVDCRQMNQLPAPSIRDRHWGFWSPERFGWKRGPGPVLYPKAIPYRGAQALFDVPDSVLQEVADGNCGRSL